MAERGGGDELLIYEVAFNINMTIDHWSVNSKFAFDRIRREDICMC